MEKSSANMKSCLQPLPKVLVSCRGLDGGRQCACSCLLLQLQL